MKRTLQLDCSYKPVGIINANKAFSMIYTGRATLVEHYDGEFLTSPSFSYRLPCVVATYNYVKTQTVSFKCTRTNIIVRDGYICQYCGGNFSKPELTVDHILPKSKGGDKSWENLVACCHACNQKKGDKLLSQTQMSLLRLPFRPTNAIQQMFQGVRKESKWIPYLSAYGIKQDINMKKLIIAAALLIGCGDKEEDSASDTAVDTAAE